MNGRLNTMYSNTENPNKSEKSLYPPDKHGFSEISSGRPNRMGEGNNGPSHCPLPKVVARSKEKSLKSYVKPKNRGKSPKIEIISQESRQVLEKILDILSQPSLSLTYFQRSAHTDTDLKLAKIHAGMYNEHCW